MKAKPKDIRKAREQSGLTQTAAAAKIGYSLRAWQEWEGGRRPMRKELLAAFREIAKLNR